MKRKLWLIPALITGLCMVLSFIAGHYMPWTPLGTPPEPAVEILATSRGAVVVESNTGQTYICAVEIPFPSDFPRPYGCTWQEVARSEFGEGVAEKDEQCPYFLPPGWVVDRFYFCSSPEWRYVALANGSVWTYFDDFDSMISWFHYYRYTFFFPVGTLIGFLLGITVYGLLRWRRRRTT